MVFRPGVTAVDHAGVAAVLRDANDEDAAVYVLSGAVDRRSFFDAVRRTFPLDPPVMSDRSWDALQDSLWESLFSTGDQVQVIVWSDAAPFRAAAGSPGG